ncbi:hypothetical protein C8A03DRAFT_34025 [Achaetomium macrosporum]|uniref:Uncharacterized protein n=1 Tax=Achaetomium macrosporum TaxID=79813 RepID=A0AAN7CA43_9PEZI|nr:hypothetical protein C8A03DRAFT_34025 [Achaetomium macrosporum]
MTPIEEQYKHLRLVNEIKPLLHRYGIQYNPKANKANLLQLLQANGVPLDRVQQNKTAPNLNTVEVLGLAQIDVDYPPSDSNEGSGNGSGEDSGESSGESLDSNSTTTRSIQRLVDLPGHEGHAEKARQAAVRTLKKVTGLVDWFASVAKSQNIPVGSALVFFDSYLSSPNLDFVAYLLDKDNSREGWYEHAISPDTSKQAAKRLDNLWSLALDPTDVARTATTTTTISCDPTSDQHFLMDVIDPFDNMPAKGKVIGIHMTKKNTLGVRLPSLSTEYPDLGRGLWVDCKSGKELAAYKQYIKTFPGKGKLSSAPEILLAGCETPADFELDSVFMMKWGKTYHCYGYGRPKNGDLRHLLMFSKTTLSKLFRGAPAMEMLQTHRNRTGQARYEGAGEPQHEVITLRAKRSAPVQ